MNVARAGLYLIVTVVVMYILYIVFYPLCHDTLLPMLLETGLNPTYYGIGLNVIMFLNYIPSILIGTYYIFWFLVSIRKEADTYEY